MENPSRTNRQLPEEISVLKQKIQKLEQSESEWKKEKEELKKVRAAFAVTSICLCTALP